MVKTRLLDKIEANVAAGRVGGNARPLLMDAEYHHWQNLEPGERLAKYRAQDTENNAEALFCAIRQAYAEHMGWE